MRGSHEERVGIEAPRGDVPIESCENSYVQQERMMKARRREREENQLYG